MLKIIPLGGMEVTKNLFVYETDNQILLVDCGIGFPDESMLGVDILIPDTTYLKQSKKTIVGLLLSHGHDDHIAGLPYVLPKLPKFPIFASRLTAGFASERMKEFGINRKINLLDDKRGIRLGEFAIETAKVTHSVPDGRHFFIRTDQVSIYHGSDFKFDLTPIDNQHPQFQKIASFGKQGIDLLLSDCLRSEMPGFSQSESMLSESFENEIRNTRGKVIFTTMSSNVHRIQQAIDIATRTGRKVALFGRSVESNSRIAQELGFLKLPGKMMISKKKVKNFDDDKLALIVAGSQGQEGSALFRIAHQEHHHIKVKPQDKVIFAADPIPGNEKAVYKTIDALARQEAEVVYHDINDALHVSGHAHSGDLMLLMELLKPKYLLPIGGTYRHMVQYRKLAEKIGYSQNKVFLLEEGQTLKLERDKASMGKQVAIKNVMVDGLGIGDVGRVVLRDRQLMAEEGMLVIIVTLEEHSAKLVGDIEIISRGVVFMKESKELINKIKSEVQAVLKQLKLPVKDWRMVKNKINKKVEKLLIKELERFPLIIPLIIRI